jgi:phage/plasmid-associated DNA primase
MLFGSSANGKCAFLNTIRTLLGDCAASTQTVPFSTQNDERINNNIARLHTRFVTTTETDQGACLSEPRIKPIAGADWLTARFLFGECCSYPPAFKVWRHAPFYCVSLTTMRTALSWNCLKLSRPEFANIMGVSLSTIN